MSENVCQNPVKDTTQGWNAVIETNLTGTYLMSREGILNYINFFYIPLFEVHQQYMSEHGGVIVNIIADMFRGFPMMAHTGKLKN